NPLMGVMNCISLLKNGSATPERKEVYLDTITNALEQISSTVRALLGYSRERPEDFAAVDVAAIVSTCLQLIAPVLRTRRVEVLPRIPPQEMLVWGNNSQLSQAAMNVLLNAVQASDAGSQVTISAERRGGRVGLCFEDRGPGIPRDQLQKVCDPFFT